MMRRMLASTLFAAVAALGVTIAVDPVATPTVGSSAPAPGVTLNSSVIELAAAKGTPCNAGAGQGTAGGRCPTPTPSPSATSCPGSCKPLLSDSKAGAILQASTMKPGDVARGTTTITANGNVYVSLLESNVTHTGPDGSSNLAHRLTLVITDQTANVPIYSGALDSMPTSISVCGDGPPPHEACPRWANNESHTFLFVVTLPNAGDDSDNAYQHTGASADIIWGATR